MVEPSPHLRLAVPEDAPGIDALMKASIEAIFPSFHDAQQTASSRTHIGDVDPMLIGDGTYFVLEADDLIVACGGWSRRDKLFTGSSDQEGRARLLDPAIEPARVRAMFVHATGRAVAWARASSRPARLPPARRASGRSP